MKDTDDVTTAHAEYCRMVEEPALRRVERNVIGCDYGATSNTTRAQADRLAQHLKLGADTLLLDIGSGAGWPGIYLADKSSARVILTDIPKEGLAVASHRLKHDDVPGGVVAASGDSLPFRDQMFDAVTSSDVLC